MKRLAFLAAAVTASLAVGACNIPCPNYLGCCAAGTGCTPGQTVLPSACANNPYRCPEP